MRAIKLKVDQLFVVINYILGNPRAFGVIFFNVALKFCLIYTSDTPNTSRSICTVNSTYSALDVCILILA